MQDLNLFMNFHFVDKTMSGPGSDVSQNSVQNALYNITSTGDGFILLMLLLAILSLIGFIFFLKFKNSNSVKNSNISGNFVEKYFLGKKVLAAVFCAIAAVTLILASITIFKTTANADVKPENFFETNSNINVAVNEDGSLTFDQGWIRNISSVTPEIVSSNTKLTDQVQSVPGLSNAQFMVAAVKNSEVTTLFSGNPNGADYILEKAFSINPNDTSVLNFNLEGLEKDTIKSLIDKDVFAVSLKASVPVISIDKPVAKTGLVYNNGNEIVGVDPGEGYEISGNTATDAGDYVAKAKPLPGYAWSDDKSDTEIDIPWSVAKADGALELSSYDTQIEVATSETIKYTAKGDGELSVSSSDENAITASVDSSNKEITLTAKNVGESVITFTVPESKNYKAVSKTETFTVVAAKITVTAQPYDGTFDNMDHYAQLKSNVDEVDIAYGLSESSLNYSMRSSKTDEFFDLPEVSQKDAGKITVYYKVSKENYADVTGSTTINVTPKNIGANWNVGTYTYNGEVQKPTATCDSKVTGDNDIEFIFEMRQKGSSSTVDPINAATYTAKIVGIKYTGESSTTGNYAFASNFEYEKDFTIGSKPLTSSDISLEWGDAVLVYNGHDQYAVNDAGLKLYDSSIGASGVQLTQFNSVTGAGDFAIVSGDKSISAGDVPISISGKGNYGGNITDSWTINKKDITDAADLTASKQNYTDGVPYDSLNHKFDEYYISKIYFGTEGQASYLEMPNGSYTVTSDEYSEVPDEGSMYEFTIQAKDDSNFEGTYTGTWTISPYHLTEICITGNMKTAQYNESGENVTASGYTVRAMISSSEAAPTDLWKDEYVDYNGGGHSFSVTRSSANLGKTDLEIPRSQWVVNKNFKTDKWTYVNGYVSIVPANSIQVNFDTEYDSYKINEIMHYNVSVTNTNETAVLRDVTIQLDWIKNPKYPDVPINICFDIIEPGTTTGTFTFDTQVLESDFTSSGEQEKIVTYQAIYTYVDGTGYYHQNFEHKTALELTDIDPPIHQENFTYTGEAQGYDDFVSNGLTIYTVTDDAKKTDVNTDGPYIAKIQLTSNAYQWTGGSRSDLTYEWNITKAQLNVKAKDNTITYGDAPSSSGVEYGGWVGKDISVADKNTLISGSLNYTFVHVGTTNAYNQYDDVANDVVIVPSGGISLTNYEPNFENGALIINRREVNLYWNYPAPYKYDEKSHFPTATVVNSVNGDKVEVASYSFSDSVNNSVKEPINVGDYKARAAGVLNSNYTVNPASPSSSCDFKIVMQYFNVTISTNDTSSGLVKNESSSEWKPEIVLENVAYGQQIDWYIISKTDSRGNIDSTFELSSAGESSFDEKFKSSWNANGNFHFNSWTNGDTPLGKNGSVKITSDMNFVANYSNAPKIQLEIEYDNDFFEVNPTNRYVSVDSDSTFTMDEKGTLLFSSGNYSYTCKPLSGNTTKVFAGWAYNNSSSGTYTPIKANVSYPVSDVYSKIGALGALIGTNNYTVSFDTQGYQEKAEGYIEPDTTTCLCSDLSVYMMSVDKPKLRVSSSNPNVLEMTNGVGIKTTYNALPVDENSKFAEWKYIKASGEDVYIEPDKDYTITSNITVTACFAIDKWVCVTPVAIGDGFGSFDLGPTLALDGVWVPYGTKWEIVGDKLVLKNGSSALSTIIPLTNPEYCEFKGWKTDGLPSSIEENTTVYAEFANLDTTEWIYLTPSIDKMAGSGAFIDHTESIKLPKDSKVKINSDDKTKVDIYSKGTASGAKEKDVYVDSISVTGITGGTFDGWYLSKDGEEAQLVDEAVLTESQSIIARISGKGKAVYCSRVDEAGVTKNYLTFYCDCSTHESDLGFVKSFPITYSYFDVNNASIYPPSWSGQVDPNVVVFDSSFINFKKYDLDDIEHAGEPFSSLSCWFYNCSSIQSITGFENIDQTNIDNVVYAFGGYAGNKSGACELNLSGLSLPAITDISQAYLMFDYSLWSKLILPSNFLYNLTSYNANYKIFSDMDNLKSIESVDVHDSHTMFENVKSLNGLFNEIDSSCLETIDLRYLVASQCRDFSYMFENLRSIKNINLGNLDTSNATDMSYMFATCNKIESIDVSGFNTAKVKSVDHMFAWCYELSFVDMSTWNMNKAINFDYMFWVCYKLKSIDLSGMLVSSKTSADSMFGYCNQISNVKLGKGFGRYTMGELDTGLRAETWHSKEFEGNKTSSELFIPEGLDEITWLTGCSMSLRAEPDWAGYVTSNWGDSITWDPAKYFYLEYGKNSRSNPFVMEYHEPGESGFSGCELRAVSNNPDLYTFDHWESNPEIFTRVSLTTSCDLVAYFNVTSIKGVLSDSGVLTLYYDSDKHEGQNFESFEPSGTNVNFSNNFQSMTKKVVIDSSMLNNDKLTSMKTWFSGFENVTSIEGLDNIPTEKIENLYGTFSSCQSLSTIHFPDNFKNMSCIKTMENMFSSCNSLTEVSGLNNIPVETLENTNEMFMYCHKLKRVDISSWNTLMIKDIAWMFENCYGLEEVLLNNFITEKVTSKNGMFKECNSLSRITVGSGFKAGFMSLPDKKWFDNSNNFYDGTNQLNTGIPETGTRAFYVANQISFSVDPYGSGVLAEGEDPVYYSSNKVPTYSINENSLKINIPGQSSVVKTATDWGDFPFKEWASYPESVSTDIHGDIEFKARYFAPKAKAVVSIDGSTLTFVYDDFDYPNNTWYEVPRNYTCQNTDWSSDDSWVSPFANESSNIKNVTFDNSFRNFAYLQSMSFWFYGFNQLESVENFENIPMNRVSNMSHMFYGCSSLNDIDLTGIGASSMLTDLRSMFYGCSSLVSANLNSLDVSSVTAFTYMFRYCTSLENVGIENWNTTPASNSSIYSYMFASCDSLKYIDLSGISTMSGYVPNIFGYYAGNIESFKVSDKWQSGVSMSMGLASVWYQEQLNYSSPREIELNYTAQLLEPGRYYVQKSLSLKSFPTEVNPDTRIIKYSSQYPARYARALKDNGSIEYQLAVGTGYEYGSTRFFYPEDGLKDKYTKWSSSDLDNIDPDTWYYANDDTVLTCCYDIESAKAVYDYSNDQLTFYYDNKYYDGCLNFDVPTDYDGWNSPFYEVAETCKSVVIDPSFKNFGGLSSCKYWFYNFRNCTSITGLGNIGSNWVTSFSHMFADCEVLKEHDIDKLDVWSGVEFDYFVYDNYKIEKLDLRNWFCTKGRNFKCFARWCEELKYVDISGINIAGASEKSVNICNMFDYCHNVEMIYANTSWRVERYVFEQWNQSVFDECYNLVGEAGTEFSQSCISYEYAICDGGEDNPGYFYDRHVK